jgi:Methane oxygenase PmoA
MKNLFLSALCLAVLTPAARAESMTFEITVAAGKHERVNDPVRVTLSVPASLSHAQATLTDAGGKSVPCQVTDVSLDAIGRTAQLPQRELHFLLSKLKAGETAKFTAVLDSNTPTSTKCFSWHDTKGEFTELRFGDKPALRYVYKALDDKDRENTFKVYHHLYDPTGTMLVTKGPGGLYTHHRGIFYGFMKVTYDDNKVVDIWHCKEQTYQSHDKFLAEEAGVVLGRHRVEIGWHGKNKELFAKEERELTVYNTPGGRLVEFTSRLTSVKGTVKLDGDPQHAGFHFRAAQEVAEKHKNETFYVRPDGIGGKGEKGTRNWPAQKEHVNLPWDAMCFILGDKRYTCAYLDKPTNPKEARYSERDYGRFGSYFVTEVTDKKPLTVNYRLWLQEGEMTPAQVAALSAEFVDPVKVTVK